MIATAHVDDIDDVLEEGIGPSKGAWTTIAEWDLLMQMGSTTVEVLRIGGGLTEGQVMKSFCEHATGHPMTWRMSVVGAQSRETLYILDVDTEG